MRHNRRPFARLLVAAALVAVGGAGWLSAQYVVAQRKAGSTSRADIGQEGAAEPGAAEPRVAIDHTEFRFGDLDPADRCEHVFVVRNEGNAPLQLARGRTSCRCTMSELPGAPILPGQHAEIRVGSKIAQTFGYFSHEAEVLTNDPACKVLRLRISGVVRAALAAEPARVVFAPVRAGEQASAEVTVYSQLWEAFDLASITASHPALQWEVRPADAETLGRLKARCGYRLKLTAPAELPGKSLWEALQLTAVPKEKPPRVLKIDVAGTTLRRIGLYGPQMDAQGVVQLGAFESAEGAQTQVTVKVRDEHRSLRVLQIQADPDFLKAELKPLSGSAVKYGLYAVPIRVPPGAPPGSYVGPSEGTIRIATDHPHVPVLEIKVAFIVRGR